MADIEGRQLGHGPAISIRPRAVGWASRPLRWLALVRTLVITQLLQASDRFFHKTLLKSDRYDRMFFFGLGAVLVFTIVVYWSLTTYWDVRWLSGEDGASEWWSVATYLAAAAMGAVTARLLKRMGHPRIATVHLVFVGAFLLGTLEEISWGQRLFGWSTPGALSSVNEQDETTLHNLSILKTAVYTAFFWASVLALAGAVVRGVLHLHGRITTADFILPSLLLSPALLMIVVWIRDGEFFWIPIPQIFMTYLDLRPIGTEVPEVLAGLCLVLYSYGNLKRAFALRGRSR